MTTTHTPDFRVIARAARATGGGTYGLVGQRIPVNGYMVGGLVAPVVRPELRPEDIDEFVRVNAFALSIPMNFLGLWKDENGNWWLDVSQHFESRAVAISAGVARNEIAIWDVAEAAEIRLRLS